MRLSAELYRELGFEVDLDVEKINYFVVDGRGGYFQNVRRIDEFSPEKIVLRGRKTSVAVVGKGLALGKYFSGDVAVFGDVERVERIEK